MATCIDAEAMANRLQRCARFDRPRIQTLRPQAIAVDIVV